MAVKRYRYRAYPDLGQQRALLRVFGCVRVVFNDVIAARRDQHRLGLPFESASELQTRLVTQAKDTPAREWLAHVSSTPLQQSVRDAGRAYRNFFTSLAGKRKGARVGAPRFKKRSNRQAARFTRQCGFSVTTTTHGVAHVRIPKVGHVRFALSRELPSAASSVTVIREADGRYYVSFVVETTPDTTRMPKPLRGAVGIDVGLTHLAVLVHSDGTRVKVDNPRWFRAAERKLARAQRRLSRKEKGSANRVKAATLVATQHRNVREARLDHHHKLALRIVRENQAIAVEGISASALARTRMGKSVLDAGWATLIRLITEKGADYGRQVIAIDRWAPTSQTCSLCGVKDGPKPLSVRVWTCKSCGAVLDRDYNAAVNVILAAGLAESLNACGGDIRRQLAVADPDEAGTHRTDPT